MLNLHNIFLSVVLLTLLVPNSMSNLQELIKIVGLYKMFNLQLLLLQLLLVVKDVLLHLPVIKLLLLQVQCFLLNVLNKVLVGFGLLLLIQHNHMTVLAELKLLLLQILLLNLHSYLDLLLNMHIYKTNTKVFNGLNSLKLILLQLMLFHSLLLQEEISHLPCSV